MGFNSFFLQSGRCLGGLMIWGERHPNFLRLHSVNVL